MSADRHFPLLRPDVQVKAAMAKALGVDQIGPLSRRTDPVREREALREMIVAGPDDVVRRIQAEHGVPGEDPVRRANLLLAEIITFCPVPLPGWQARAKHVLAGHHAHWRQQLGRIRQELENAVVYTLPFGRILLDGEPIEAWLPEPETVVMQATALMDGVTESCEITYFRRPFIAWPTDAPGSLRHVSQIAGTPIGIERLPLDHPLLRLEPPRASARTRA